MTWTDYPCRRWDGYHRPSDGRPLDGRQYAYRTNYEKEIGPLPNGVGHHLCENKWCAEPRHLEFITQGEHLKEHGLHGDWGQANKTQCPAGHDYDEENTYRYTRKDGRKERHCKRCVLVAKRRYREKKRRLENTP